MAEVFASAAFEDIEVTATKSGKKLVYTSSKQESEAVLCIFGLRH